MALSSIESRMASALFAHLATFIITPQLPIAWPGLTPPWGAGSRPARYLYLSVSFNDPQRPFQPTNASHRFSGSLLISYCTALVGGAIGPAETAGRIADHFEEDDKLSFDGLSIRIIKRGHVIEGYPDSVEQRWRTPIIIPFEAWVRPAS